ncbi:MAG: YggT family protein [Lactobacillaceae bacterium]|jgi:YggT family protein|nr:YggT family protein [Lactobacillaceae bacterium]
MAIIVIISNLAYYVLQALELIIVLSALMSWLPGATQSPLGRFIGRIAGLIVDPIRRMLPPARVLDFSPIVAILLLSAAEMGLRALVSMLVVG